MTSNSPSIVIEMYSIFEEEEMAMRRMILPSPRVQPSIVSFTVTSTIAPRSVEPTSRKRTRFEAYERASPVLELSTALGQSFPLARPYTTLFNATFAGLTLVDPLNRLEGIA